MALGLWKWFARTTAPAVLNWPGGSWAFGVAAGVIVTLGFLGARWFSELTFRGSRMRRAGHGVGTAICGGTAFAVLMYILASLPGKNCPSYRAGCQYIPGTGSALIACLATSAVLGWGAHYIANARAEERQKRERERIRKLRKKGKGKARMAR
ncbi:hypothetical protein RB628_26960 [Streptomyces sp. ADMS]|uniref:hypothetical protein n=1 Tax=Streptomyces sp. ADMS TaxID=3071415 RepID=UPI00296EA572|nr:hypothetical protein [Streptomyces sp. ADMS]MDW4908885.1 hypothetical protein [Streptomyces sp. ADMS]